MLANTMKAARCTHKTLSGPKVSVTCHSPSQTGSGVSAGDWEQVAVVDDVALTDGDAEQLVVDVPDGVTLSDMEGLGDAVEVHVVEDVEVGDGLLDRDRDALAGEMSEPVGVPLSLLLALEDDEAEVEGELVSDQVPVPLAVVLAVALAVVLDVVLAVSLAVALGLAV